MSFQFEPIKDEIYRKMSENSDDKNFVSVKPLKYPKDFPLEASEDRFCTLSNRYIEFAEEIKNFEVRSDDVWLISYPKSGTTWTQEMVWLLKNKFDFKTALDVPMVQRFPFMEISGLRELPGNRNTVEIAKNMPSPRLIKTHLPIQLLPDQIWTVKPKIIYVKRNCKDVAVSYFHHSATLHGYVGPMEDFLNAFLNEWVLYSPYHLHIIEYCRTAKKLDNFLVLNFEDLKKDLKMSIKNVAQFLDVPIVDNKNVDQLVKHLSFENMKKNKSVNAEDWVQFNLSRTNRTNKNNENLHFIRKGKVGGWKDEMSPEMVQKFDEWILKNISKYPDVEKYCVL